ncbi:hypothetical protein RM590_32830 [Streptomyces sp. DSM 44938]|uniref:Uncharacterized protein n=1 Tax=Streptomyces litchfieldiae TaxID=3075543 RepID=A0ABU2N0C2_9ACTN|nr:hypothetical protein [Streptomyces sp. DSM 44938]MDT0347325.1 hypothetical protein [Streptomyces sp. DSM 44938]
MQDAMQGFAVDEVNIVDDDQQRLPGSRIQQLGGDRPGQSIGIHSIRRNRPGQLPQHTQRNIIFLGGSKSVEDPDTGGRRFSRKSNGQLGLACRHRT